MPYLCSHQKIKIAHISQKTDLFNNAIQSLKFNRAISEIRVKTRRRPRSSEIAARLQISGIVAEYGVIEQALICL